MQCGLLRFVRIDVFVVCGALSISRNCMHDFIYVCTSILMPTIRINNTKVDYYLNFIISGRGVQKSLSRIFQYKSIAHLDYNIITMLRCVMNTIIYSNDWRRAAAAAAATTSRRKSSNKVYRNPAGSQATHPTQVNINNNNNCTIGPICWSKQSKRRDGWRGPLEKFRMKND